MRILFFITSLLISLSSFGQLRVPPEVFIRGGAESTILQTHNGVSTYRTIAQVLGTGGITQMFGHETITGGVRLKLGNLGGETDFLEGTGITITRVDNKYTFSATATGGTNYTAGAGLQLNNNAFSLIDPSSQASVNNSGQNFIQDITLDAFGRVTGLTTAAATDANTTYTAGGGLTLSGTQFRLTDPSTQASVNNSGRTVIQDITLDAYGRVTGLASANLSDANTTYTAGGGLTLSGTSFSLTDPSSQASVNNSGATFIQDITLDAYGRVTALTSADAPSGGTADGNGIYSANGTADGRFVGVGSSGLTFTGNGSSNYPFNFSAIRVRGTLVNEGFFSTQSSVSTPSNSTTGIDYVGYRASTSALLNNGTTIVGGESALYLKTPNQYSGTAATGMVMTLQSNGTASWQTASGGNTYSAGGGLTLSGTTFSLTDPSNQSSVNNSGQNFIQDVTLDAYGRVTGLTTGIAANTTYSAGGGITQSGTTFSLTDPSNQSSVNNSGQTFIQDITLDGYGRVTGLVSGTASGGTADGNGIYGGNGTVNGRTVTVGSSSLYFTGSSATNAEIRGTQLSESFFNNQTSISTPSSTTTGWDGMGYRSSTSYLMNNGTTIVRGEGALYLAPPNQATASTGWVMTKQSDGTASWQAAAGGGTADGNGIYSANGTVNGRNISVGSSDLFFNMTSSTSNINFDGGRIWGTSMGETVFSNQSGISTPSGTTTGWDYVGYRGSTSALMNNGTTIVRGEGSLYIAPPNQSTANEGEVLTKQSNGTTQWDLGGKFSKAEYITGAGSADNTFTATSPVYIQTAADNLILDDNRAGRVFVIQVHSGNAQINTTSGTLISNGTGFTNGTFFQPIDKTYTYIRNDANTHWIVLKN